MLKILYWVVKDINVLRPHQVVKDVNAINFSSLSNEGIKYVVFDKDQTVTLQDSFEYYNQNIVESIKKAQNIIGEERIAFLSNSRNKEVIRLCKEKLGITHIPSQIKKPFNGEDILKHFAITSKEASQVCVVGDRLLTDVLLGNLNGMRTIYTVPIDRSGDSLVVKPIRFVEELILEKVFNIKV